MKAACSTAAALAFGIAVLVVCGGAGLAGNKTDELSAALLSDPSFKVRTQAALLLGKL